MTIRECYIAADGDFEDVLRRFMSEERVAKFAVKFLKDSSFSNLTEALAAGDLQEAFRAAHTLKGLCFNLGFKKLGELASTLTEILRPLEPVDTSDLMNGITEAYSRIVDALNQFQG